MLKGKHMKMEVIQNGRAVPKELARAVVLDASDRFRARQLERRLEITIERHRNAPERQSISTAMLAVEERLVKAFWTIARQPGPSGSSISRCGVSYLHDGSDVDARYVDAAGGKWEAIAPRPSLPSSRDIDQANAALDWLLLIDDHGLRRLLVIGATSKRGDAGRRIGWIRLRASLPEYGATTVRTLQRKYQEALRIIVTELTIARMSHVSHKRI